MTTHKAISTNKTGVIPKGHAVLAEPFEKKKDNSLIVLPDNVKERSQMIEDRLRILDHGAACWIDEPEPRAQIGDLVLIPNMAGRMVRGTDGKMYRIINDKDVIAVVDEKVEGQL